MEQKRIHKPWLIIPELRVAYCYFHKCGSTSVVDALRRAAGKDLSKPIHKSFSGPFLSMRDFWMQQIPAKYYTCTFIRNPYSRLVSCYKDRILRKRAKGFPKSFYRDMSFGDFLKAVDLIFPGNSHIFPYWPNLMDTNGDCFVDFVGKLEDINDDWKTLQGVMSFDLPEIPEHNRTKQDDWKRYYTDSWMKDLVWELYKTDFEMFGYDRLN